MPRPAAEPTTVHLVRHATHGLLPHTLAGRTPGVPLSPEGVAQAAELAERFAGRPIHQVVTSPVQRARETAAPIAARLGLVPLVDPGFDEIDFGTWNGRGFADLDGDPAWQVWNGLRSLSGCPDGETMHQAQSRALLAFTGLRHTNAGQTIIVVSHADILKAILATVLGLTLDMLQRFSLDPASVSTVTMFDDAVRVDRLNS